MKNVNVGEAIRHNLNVVLDLFLGGRFNNCISVTFNCRRLFKRILRSVHSETSRADTCLCLQAPLSSMREERFRFRKIHLPKSASWRRNAGFCLSHQSCMTRVSSWRQILKEWRMSGCLCEPPHLTSSQRMVINQVTVGLTFAPPPQTVLACYIITHFY